MVSTISINPNVFMAIAMFKERKIKYAKDRWIGFSFSLSTHILLLLIGGMLFIKPVEFGIDRGLSSMDVQLVDGSSEPVAIPQPVKEEVIPEPIRNVEAVPTPVQEKVVETVKATALGNSAVSAVSTNQGAETEIKPSYLNNPAPRYPFEARQKGWDGTVTLKVRVDKDGKPLNIDIQQSSGHKVLDEAALKTVKTWNFRPAHFGNMTIESLVIVPVRFDLRKV